MINLIETDVGRPVDQIRSASLHPYILSAPGFQEYSRADAGKRAGTPSDLRVGQSEFQNILQFAAALDSSAQTAETQIRNSVAEFGEKVAAQLKIWRVKDVQAQQTIEAKKKELEAQGIRLDMAYIQKLAQEEASYAKELAELKVLKAELAELKRQRIVLLKDRWAARDKIATIRDAYARKASGALLESLHDIKVSLKYIRNAYAPDAARQIQDVMGWRTIQVQRAQILVEALTVPRLLEAIEKNDIGPLTALKVDNVRLFPPAETGEIIKRLAQPAVKFALERCTVEDLPKLTITKNISNDPKKPNYVSRDFSRLSRKPSVLTLLTGRASAK